MTDPAGDLQGWRIDLAWRGEGYVGWQRQPNGPSIQGAVEDALRQALGGEVVAVSSTGRTDAGVHAMHQVAGFSARSPRRPDRLRDALNALLPDDIACLDARLAPLDFDPRRWTLQKTYRYRILARTPRCPFRAGQTWHHRRPLDVPAMAAAAPALVGTHDFSSFRAAGCGARSPVRRVLGVDVRLCEDEVLIDVSGHGFLRHQVRIFAGTLVEIGAGRLSADALPAVLAARDRSQAGPTAPAQGLWLMRVVMGDGPREGSLI